MKNGTSDPIISAIFASASRGKFVSNSSLSASRVEAASLLPPPRPAPCGILFLSSIETPLVIFVSSKKSSLHAPQYCLRLAAPTDHRSETRSSCLPERCSILISSTKRNRRDERLDFVKAIAATAENSQRKIDLRGSEDLHNLQFALSFRAKSRNLLLLVERLRCLDFARTMTNAADKIIVALDVATKEKALELVEQLRDEISFFKIGLQLYTAEGPEIVRAVLATGAKVWLDLKLYDIPNTVARAVESASTLGVQMLTIHLSGGSEMIRAATARSRQRYAPSGSDCFNQRH